MDDAALTESVSLWKLKLSGKEICMMGNPLEIDGKFLTLDQPPPLKGEHTKDILKELGYGPQDIQGMISEGIAYGLD